MKGPKAPRKIVVVTRRGATGPVVVAASLVTAAACGSEVLVPETSGAGPGASSTSVGGAGGQGGDGGSLVTVGGSPTGPGGMGPCDPGETADTFFVTVPPEGVPATVGDICSGPMPGQPIESNTAARITLLKDPQALNMATGQVTIAAALLADVSGLPTIEVVSSPIPELQQMMVSNVVANATGFSFDAAWPPLAIDPSQDTVMILRTTFDLVCDPNQTRQVQAHTHVNLCDVPGDVAWVSSGDECTICGIIAEMAPSPIVPDRRPDDVGLGAVIRLRLVIVAAVGSSLVILAEHDAGPGVDYEWCQSGGALVEIAPDVVLWTPTQAGAVLQVAVTSDDGAAVASYSNVPVREAGLVA